jgi:hypothetical protein
VVVLASSNHLDFLMDALGKLRRQYTLIYWFVMIAVAIGFLVALVSVWL